MPRGLLALFDAELVHIHTKKLMSKKKAPTKTSPAKSKTTTGGPARAADAAADVLDVKMAGTQALAQSMPYNPTKPGEYGTLAARGPEEGAHVQPPDPIVGASTVTESNSSDKVGSGVATPGDN